MADYEFELDAEELAPPKPLSPERQAEINDLYSRIAAGLAEINGEAAAAFEELCEMR